MGTKVDDNILDMICSDLEELMETGTTSVKREYILQTAMTEIKIGGISITGHNMWDYPRGEVASDAIRERIRYLKKYLKAKYEKKVKNMTFLAIGESYKCSNWQTKNITAKLKISFELK